MKKFITAVPLQTREGGLEKFVYDSEGNSLLKYAEETSFPVIPIINGYTEVGEEIQIIIILDDYPAAHKNFDIMKSEIDAICARKKLSYELLILHRSFDEKAETQLKTFAKTIDTINDGDIIHACITFGSKPTPIVEFMAMNYAYKTKKNISIGCIAYGKVDHAKRRGELYDMTSLFFMNELAQKIAYTGNPDVAGTISRIIFGDETEE